MAEIYEVAVMIGSGAMIYMSSFIKINLGIQRLILGYTYRHTDSEIIS
jgi:hypothetical protein